MKLETLAALAVLVVVPVVLMRGRDQAAGMALPGPSFDLSYTDDPITWSTWSIGAVAGPGAADDMPDQLSGLVASVFNRAYESVQAIPQSLGVASTPPPSQDFAARNVAAFLDLIAYAEGTSGPNGYRTMFGGRLFESFADHPRVFHAFTDRAGRTLRTSAAGRYQFLSRTWDTLAKRLGLPDFGPHSQDLAAIELIRERGALSDVRAGRVAEAVAKCAPVWASLPGAGYAQPERKLSSLVAAFTAAGGTLET